MVVAVLPQPVRRMVPIAIVPLIIRLGPAYPLEESLSMRSYAHTVIGSAPWPKQFITDERGIAIEPNRPTHYRGG
jgi:hypothetical protein